MPKRCDANLVKHNGTNYTLSPIDRTTVATIPNGLPKYEPMQSNAGYAKKEQDPTTLGQQTTSSQATPTAP